MPLLINATQVVEDNWQEADQPMANALTPFATLIESTVEDLSGKDFGVRLSTGDDIELLRPFLPKLGLIVISVEKFADGRAFSFASHLKSTLSFQGIVRAEGDVIPDQATFYFRCGFDQLKMRTDQEAVTALKIVNNIEIQYQSDVKQPQPLLSGGPKDG